MQKFEWESMGTHWSVSIGDKIPKEDFESIRKNILDMSQDFDQKYSRFIDTSLVMQMSREKGIYLVGEDLINIINIYFEIEEISHGRVTPCVGNSLSDLGYDKDYSFRKQEIVRAVPKLKDVLRVIDKESLEILFPVILDIGAIGKGYFVDKVVQFLRKQNHTSFIVDGSGDIYCEGLDTPLSCGLENPFDFTEVLGVVKINNSSLCSSGITRRKWTVGDKNLNHYIDPHTLSSVENIVATFVVSSSATLSDTLTTCLFFVDPEILKEKYSFEYLVVDKNKKLTCSEFFEKNLFLKD